MIIVYLTCADDKEADAIVEALLDKRLVACAKRIPIESAFWWEGKKDSVDEILVMFETAEEKFDELEKVVDELHSYEAPMLFSIQVHRTTDKVSKWLKEELS
jgi:periplasmic divalent cation tolerance protein